MARKTNPTVAEPLQPATITTGLTEVAQEANMAILAEQYASEQRDIARLIGRREGRTMMAKAFQKLYQITDLVDLQAIKESKKYKGFRVSIDGELVTITTWAEYCLHIEGKSVEAVDLELGNFKQLGNEFFDAMRQIGIGPGTMRDIRRLPEDEKQALLVVAESGDKDSFIDLAESVIAKHAQEKAALTQEVAEIKANYEALDKIEHQTRERLTALEREAAKGDPLHNWPEQIDGLKDDLHTLGKVMDEVLSKHLTLVDATDLVYQQMDEDDPAHDQYKGVVFRMAEQIERLCTLAAGLRNQFGLRLSGYIDMDKTYILPYEQE